MFKRGFKNPSKGLNDDDEEEEEEAKQGISDSILMFFCSVSVEATSLCYSRFSAVVACTFKENVCLIKQNYYWYYLTFS